MSITMETAERWLAQEMEDMNAEREDIWQQQEKLDNYDEMESAVFQEKQNIANSAANARAAKKIKEAARRRLSRRLYREMAGLVLNKDIIAVANRQSEHGEITRSAFYRHIEGL